MRKIADFASERGIPYVGRGSAADSLVAYCLELTDARQLEILVALSQQALPRLQQAQEGIDREWRRWRAALESASAE